MLEKLKRILALSGAVLLAGLYIATLILSFMRSPAAAEWFRIAVSATLVIPIMLYGYILVYKLLKKNDDVEE